MKFANTRLKLLALSVTTLPVASQAATEADGLEACASAFVEKLEDTRQTRLVMRIADDAAGKTSYSPSLDRLWTKFELTAYGAGEKQVYARADCYVNAQAEVTSIRNVR